MINEKNRIMISNVMSKERITDTIRFVLFFHLNPIKTFFSKKLTIGLMRNAKIKPYMNGVNTTTNSFHNPIKT